MNRKELKKLYNLECKNMQWSWAFVNHKERFIVVQVFYEQNKNKVYSPTWGRPTQASHSEFKEYIDLVKEQNYDIKAIQATGYLDTKTNNFRFTGYVTKTLIDARLEIDLNGDIWFYPKKEGGEKIINKVVRLRRKELTKNEAILKVNLLKGSKILTSNNTHWSNIVSYKNISGWWLNIPFEKFNNDLYLILNQSNKEFLILINIPVNSIRKPKEVFRNKNETADIFIPLSDNVFIDTQSNGRNYQFSNYKIISYYKTKNDKLVEKNIFESNFEQEIKKSKNDSQQKRLARLKKSNKKPIAIEVKSIQYKRNPDVVVEVLNRANGICERCKKEAPFLRKKDNTPYLEVHHIITLANGGNDIVENAIAVCPNCHKELHFG